MSGGIQIKTFVQLSKAADGIFGVIGYDYPAFSLKFEKPLNRNDLDALWAAICELRMVVTAIGEAEVGLGAKKERG